MIVFRSPRLRGRARLHVRKIGLTDREIVSMLAPHTGDVDPAPVAPPDLDRRYPDGSIDPDERSQWAHNLP
jgi:hypothetical protein